MKSIRLDHSARVAVDEYQLYMFWALVVLAIMLAVRLGISFFVGDAGSIEVRSEMLLRGFSQVFALVVGIVNGVYAIRYFVQQGVTRHSFLLGGVLAGLGIAVSLQALAFVSYVVAGLLEPILPITVVHGGGNPVLSPVVGVVLALAFFLMGWIIGFSFCRFKVLVGLATVVAGLVVLGVFVSIWGEGVRMNIMGIGVPPIDRLSVGGALATTGVLLAGQLGALYVIVRDAPLAVE
ncbi:MAG: hypothetical protein EA428_07310 [Spirochaetaceae bacterium]|nr:MAG: hypothetical protein EA428_07310 [Spirochaetaceae bacterium]